MNQMWGVREREKSKMTFWPEQMKEGSCQFRGREEHVDRAGYGGKIRCLFRLDILHLRDPFDT